jgi:hypothetical protein
LLSTESGNNYLGYSIELQCKIQRFIPHPERRPQVYILAKDAAYFDPKDRSWDPEYFDLASAVSGVDFLAGVRQSKLPEYFPQNVTNIGFMSPMQFYETLASSVLLVGIGTPFTYAFFWEIHSAS